MKIPNGATHVCNIDDRQIFIKRDKGKWYMQDGKKWSEVHPVSIANNKHNITEIKPL